MSERRRIPILLPAILALLTALWGGIARLGWALPQPLPEWPAAHGPLMVSGFLGTLIGLERAVALGRAWGYLAPLASGLGALAWIAALPAPVAAILFALGSAALVSVLVVFARRQPSLHIGIELGGAAAWLAASVLWMLPRAGYEVVLLWAAFPLLTIVGERLELSRVRTPPRPAQIALAALAAVFLAGAGVRLLDAGAGMRIAAIALIGIALWLGRFDVATRTVRAGGLARFVALCLLSGYVWLAASGALALALPVLVSGPAYDAMLHAFFAGFVFSMIFGHAPIVFPAVLGLPVPFRRRFYAHLLLLHATLLVRVAGDLVPSFTARKVGGLLNGLVLVLFFANTIVAVRQGRRRASSPG